MRFAGTPKDPLGANPNHSKFNPKRLKIKIFINGNIKQSF
jgi:hypothetical protein